MVIIAQYSTPHFSKAYFSPHIPFVIFVTNVRYVIDTPFMISTVGALYFTSSLRDPSHHVHSTYSTKVLHSSMTGYKGVLRRTAFSTLAIPQKVIKRVDQSGIKCVVCLQRKYIHIAESRFPYFFHFATITYQFMRPLLYSQLFSHKSLDYSKGLIADLMEVKQKVETSIQEY